MLRQAPLGYFLLTFAWSWAWWTPMVLTLRSQGIVELADVPAWAYLCLLLGAYGPTIVALVLTGRERGRGGLRALLARFKLWRAPIAVHLTIWLGPPTFLVLAILAAPTQSALLGEPVWGRLLWIPVAIAAAVPFGPLAEELGWRGYALPRLQSRYSALTSSLVIGVFWCFWHTPLFWAPAGTTISGHAITVAAVAKYLAYTCGLSIIYTWIFNNSRGSVLLAVAFHASGNAILPMLLFPERDRAAALFIEELAVAPLWIFALALVAIYGASRLSRVSETSRH